VLSSTSNSRRRPVAVSGGVRAFVCAVLLVVSLLAGAEWYWRARGFLPTVQDSRLLWSYWRSKVYSAGAEQPPVVLLGSSRAQVGLVPEVVAEGFPRRRVVQLSAMGRGPYGVLDSLAKDPRFTGILICDACERFLMPSQQLDMKEYVAYYREAYGGPGQWNRLANLACEVFLQERLALLSPRIALKQQLWRRPLVPAIHHMRGDRQIVVQPRGVPAASGAPAEGPSTDELHEEDGPEYEVYDAEGFSAFVARELRPLVAAIRQRGGEVYFVRMPSEGAMWRWEERHWPRSRYWDRLAGEFPGRAIHFRDYPRLSRARCIDGTHLDFSQAREFTRALTDIIRSGQTTAPSAVTTGPDKASDSATR